ncbi:unnamed protein product [Effrenium voratum]|nr:unnamed protein product [Effrenium voratum]
MAGYEPPPGFPQHFRVASMLQQDPAGLVPYADVAFDVGPNRQGVATGRFLAHRVAREPTAELCDVLASAKVAVPQPSQLCLRTKSLRKSAE